MSRRRVTWLRIAIALLPVMVIQRLPLVGGKVQLADLAFLALGITTALSWRSVSLGARQSRWLMAWTVLLAVAGLSCVRSLQPIASAAEVAAYGYMALIALMVLATLRTWDDWLAAAETWVIASAAVALLGLAGVILGLAGIATPFAQRSPEFYVVHRPLWILTSTFAASPTPNMVCGYLLVGGLFSLGLWRHPARRERRAWYAASAVVHGLAMLFTFSRAWAMVAAAIAVWLTPWRTPAARTIRTLCLAGAVALALVTEVMAVWNITGVSLSRSSEPRGAAGDSAELLTHLDADALLTHVRVEASYLPFPRLLLRRAELALFAERPLLGIGPGAFARELYRRQQANGERWGGLRVGVPWDPHSTYLGALAELGILGFGAVLAVIGLGVWGAGQAARAATASGSPHAPVIWALFGCAIAYALWGWHDDLLTKRWVWLAMGMAVSAGTLLAPAQRYAQGERARAAGERVAPSRAPRAEARAGSRG